MVIHFNFYWIVCLHDENTLSYNGNKNLKIAFDFQLLKIIKVYQNTKHVNMWIVNVNYRCMIYG